jgi:hypothetical protein
MDRLPDKGARAVGSELPLFAVGGRSGTWGKAEKVPGSAALNVGGVAGLESVSCGSAGNCAAGGVLPRQLGPRAGVGGRREERHLGEGQGGARHRSPQRRRRSRARLAVVRLGRRLQRRRHLPGRLSPLPGVRGERGGRHLGKRRGGPRLGCAQRRRQRPDRLSVVRLGGQLRRGRVLRRRVRPRSGARRQPGGRHLGQRGTGPGSARLNAGGFAQTGPVSCASAGHCGAGGLYKDGSGHVHAFVVNKA